MPIGNGLLAPQYANLGLLGQQQQPVAPAPTAQGGGNMFSDLFGGVGSGEPNYALMAIGQGIQQGDVSGAIRDYAPIMAAGRSKNATKAWLMKKGMTAEDADVYASNPSLLSEALKPHTPHYSSAGNGVMFNEDTGQYVRDPNAPAAPRKAPTIQSFFDKNGNEIKKQWNEQTGGWDTVEGVKMTRDKVDDYTKKNRSLYSVVQPEMESLLGPDGKSGKFDALAGLGSQAGGIISGLGKTLTGGNVDLSGFTTSADYQNAKNSLSTIVASYLYSVSGQTANPGEVKNLTESLMPVPFDKALGEKKRRIQTFVAAIKKAAEGGGLQGQDSGGGNPVSGSVGAGGVEVWGRDANGDPVRQ